MYFLQTWQSIGYANLAKLDPQYGLCKLFILFYLSANFCSFFWFYLIGFFSFGLLHLDTSIVPPLIYSLMGSSRELAIGPVAVVSMLLSSLIQKIEDPVANPIAYRNLVFTVTFFAGIFQAAFGVFRQVDQQTCFYSNLPKRNFDFHPNTVSPFLYYLQVWISCGLSFACCNCRVYGWCSHHHWPPTTQGPSWDQPLHHQHRYNLRPGVCFRFNCS